MVGENRRSPDPIGAPIQASRRLGPRTHSDPRAIDDRFLRNPLPCASPPGAQGAARSFTRNSCHRGGLTALARADTVSAVLQLRQPTPEEWVHAVLSDFDSFLLDHAACERKASATALTFALHYPDRPELVSSMIELAREELEHFHTIYKEMETRGVQLAADTKDPYVNRMRQGLRKQPDLYFLDRLLVASVIEARGCERFRLLSLALPTVRLKEMYSRLR